MSDEFHGVGAELGDAGPCPTVNYGGRVWSVGWPTQRAKAELEGLVYQVAKRNIDELRPFMTADEYKAESAALQSSVRGGQHKTWGPLWVAVNNGPDTNTLFLLSLLRERHPEAQFADAAGMWATATDDVQTAMAQVIPGFFALLVKNLPGTPEQRTQLLAESVAQFLSGLNLPSPPEAGASSAVTTS